MSVGMGEQGAATLENVDDSRPNQRITLALGGGGARGIAHLGVIEVLLDAGFIIEHIVGVSIGSLVGSMYAFETDIRVAQKKALSYRPVFNAINKRSSG